MQRVLDWSVFTAVRGLEALVRSVPPGAAMGLADVGGMVWFAVDRRRRKRAWANITAAFPELPRAAQAQLVRRTFRSMARVPIEALWVPRLLATKRQVGRRIRFFGDVDVLMQHLEHGPPAILFTGHLGNWEVGAQGVRSYPTRLRLLARPISNRYVERHVQASRGGPGMVLTKRGGVGAVLRSLRQGYWVGIVGDQNAGQPGVFVPFFGIPASTHSAPAFLACRVGAPFIASVCIRRPGKVMEFDGHFALLEHPSGTDVGPDEIKDLVARSMGVLESWVRMAPEQYNWLHRRFRTKPRGQPDDPRRPTYDTKRRPEGRGRGQR